MLAEYLLIRNQHSYSDIGYCRFHKQFPIKQKSYEIINDPNDMNILKLLGLYELDKVKEMKIFFLSCKRKLCDVSGIVCTIHGIALGIIR